MIGELGEDDELMAFVMFLPSFTYLDMNVINSMADTGIKKKTNDVDALLKRKIFATKLDLKNNDVKRYSITQHQHFEVTDTNKKVWVVRCIRYDQGCMWHLHSCCFIRHGRFEIS